MKKLKLSKLQLVVFLALLISSILCIVTYVSAEQSYYADTELSDDTPLRKAFPNQEPFLYAKRGQPFFVAGIILYISWGIAICWSLVKHET